MKKKLTWNRSLMNKLLEFFNDLGLNESQSIRLVDEIDKSIIWNDQQVYYSDNDEVLLDGPADEDTCIECLLKMQAGLFKVSNLKANDEWDVSPHSNCRCNYSYETKVTMNKKQNIHHLIENYSEENHL